MPPSQNRNIFLLNKQYTISTLIVYFLPITILVLLCLPASAASDSEFPQATPESQGISSESLDIISDTIQWYYNNGMIVGAELLIIKNRHTVLHKAYGWKDRETRTKMEPNTIFNVRSMTKPLTGAAAQILIDEGKLQLDDPVFLYIPSFNTGRSSEITIRQLLTHRSGLPLSILMDIPMSTFDNIIELAEETGRRGPQFTPDSKYWYSDAGSEVLGAVVEKVSGIPLHQFITERLLEPLAMTDSFSYTPDSLNDPRWNRIASLYIGSLENWNRFWGPQDGAFYQYTLGSQSLYSTPMDYARFLAMWMEKGVFNDQRILSQEAVERTFTPVSVMTNLGQNTRYPTGFPNMYVYYGQMAVSYTDSNTINSQPVVIGHSGSDGTWAWALPEQDLIVLYFTQSRGLASGTTLEYLLDRLLVDHSQEVEIPEEYQPFVGTYTGNLFGLYNVEVPVFVQNNTLSFILPGISVFDLKAPTSSGKWRTSLSNDIAVSFVENADGEVERMRYYEGPQQVILRKVIATPVTGWILF